MDYAENEIALELDREERVLWSGMPRQGFALHGSDVFLIPFSIFWAGFAFVWEAIAIFMLLQNPGQDPFMCIFPIFGLPFVMVGVYLLFGRFWIDARIRSRTYYGVTNKRIIIITGLLSRKVKSLALGTLTDLSLTEKSNGFGTITFGPTYPFFWMFGSMQWPGMGFQRSSFDMISEVRRVYNIIRNAKNPS
jgi:hypothetical protein